MEARESAHNYSKLSQISYNAIIYNQITQRSQTTHSTVQQNMYFIYACNNGRS